MAKFDHNLRSDTFELRRKTETDCALDENEKDLLQHDVHVTLRSNTDQMFKENTSKKHHSMLRPIKQITPGKEQGHPTRI